MIKLFHKHGANIGYVDHLQQTILYFLCREGNVSAVRFCIENGMKA